MQKHWQKILAIATLLLWNSNALATAETSPTPANLKVFTYNTGAEPESIDPAKTSTVNAQVLVLQMFEGLTAQHPSEDKVVPGVAERWSLSPDGKTYTFTLRKNAQWSDGSPLTANDFWYAWERAVNPATASPNATVFQYIKNGREYLAGKIKDPKQLGFSAVDARTFRVELVTPFPPFLFVTASTTSMMPVKEEVVKKYGDKWFRPENIVSNGPFKLQTWKIYDRLILVKNPHYWDAKKVKLDQVNALVIEDLETALKRYFMGELDFLEHIPTAKIPTLLKNPEFQTALS